MDFRLIMLALSGTLLPSAALAQQAAISQTLTGARLDLVATGEVERVPDVAIVSAGVSSRSASASGALQDAGSKMERVVGALRRAGTAAADIQTSAITLNPEYRYPDNQTAQLVGYTAVNSVTIRFRNLATAGKILDSLVSEGANQVSGPTLVVDHAASALDEARARAIAEGQGRAALYARAMGMRVVRVVAISEMDGVGAQPLGPMVMEARGGRAKIEPGEQKLRVNLSMTFELQ